MSKKPSNNSAIFHALGSYGIPENKTFVLFGAVKSGQVKSGMYAKIALNNSLNLSVKIDEVTRIEIPNDKSIDTLMVIHNDDSSFYDFLLSMNVELETLQIDEDGVD